MRIFAPLTAIVSILGVATAFPSYSNRADHEKIASIIARATNSRDAGQYTAFLKKAAEIKAGKSDHADIVRRALNGTDANGDNGTDNNGFGRRKLNALINPANFKFNAQEQHIDLTSDTHKFIAPGPDDIRGPCPGLNLVSSVVSTSGHRTTQLIDSFLVQFLCIARQPWVPRQVWSHKLVPRY